MVHNAERLLLKLHAVQPGDVIGVVAGTRTSSGSTNFLRLHVVGSGEPHHEVRDERRKMPRQKPSAAMERRKR
jgi:pyruvate kinase